MARDRFAPTIATLRHPFYPSADSAGALLHAMRLISSSAVWVDCILVLSSRGDHRV